jgi:two-component system response regulator NreC
VSVHLHLATESPEMAASMITVLLADDRAAVRRSLRMLLDGEEGVEVVAEAADLTSAIRELGGHAPQVLVLDLQLTDGPGIELVRRIRHEAPGTEIVVLSMQTSAVFARRALEAGAIGYVVKERADTDLVQAVRAAVKGEEFLSPAVAAGVDAVRRALGDHGLSPREVEVLRLTALGYTGAEIAVMLHLSRRTVESHRARIHRKLGLTTRAELVRYSLGNKLIGA